MLRACTLTALVSVDLGAKLCFGKQEAKLRLASRDACTKYLQEYTLEGLQR